MRQRRLSTRILRAAVPALLIAVAFSQQGSVSVQIWIAAALAWVAGTLLIELVAASTIEPAGLRLAWQRSRKPDQLPTVYSSRGMQAVNSLLANAQKNPRTHVIQLRPRLAGLAEHYLPIRHGIDLNADPGRVQELLADVGWLIDPTVTDRAPTAVEIDRFLDVVLDEG